MSGGDPEVAVHWLTTALQSRPEEMNPLLEASALARRGQAFHRAGNLASACNDLEIALKIQLELERLQALQRMD